MARSTDTPAAIGAALASALGDRRAIPRLPWVAQLLDVPVGTLTPTVRELRRLVPTAERVRATHRAAGRSFYAQFRAPGELYLLVRRLRPAHVVETGVSSGVSSLFLQAALAANGTGVLHSIDRPTLQRGPVLGAQESPVALPPGKTTGWAVPPEVQRGWDLRLGESQSLLPGLVAELPVIDLFLHDSLHTPAHLTFELETVRPRLRPGAVVLADNTAWTGDAFPRFARSIGAPVRRRGRTDLVGLTMPGPSGRATPRTRSPRARRSRSSR